MSDAFAEKALQKSLAANRSLGRLEEWRQAMDALIALVQASVRAEISANTVRFEQVKVELTEPDLGTYWIHQAHLVFNDGDSVWVVPKSSQVVALVPALPVREAVRARADIINRRTKAGKALYWTADGWKLPDLDAGSLVDLTASRLRELLASLV